MSIEYHVYKNDGAGGPVDYSTVIATVAGLSWPSPALADGSDTTFAVRAFDTASGLEESNVDARVRVAVGPTGADITAVPTSPVLLGAVAKAAGSCGVWWSWRAAAGSIPATSFAVYLTAGSSVVYGTPAATVSVVAGQVRYSATLTGLADGTAYVVAVRASNAAGSDPNTASLPVVGSISGPENVDSLAVIATVVP